MFVRSLGRPNVLPDLHEFRYPSMDSQGLSDAFETSFITMVLATK
jgi:hypothetical protein